MNELTILEEPFEKIGIGKIRIALLNGEPLFNLYDVADNLGYVREREAKGKKYKQILKDAITKICESLDITGLTGSVSTFNITYTNRSFIDFENTWLDEQNFYDLCLGSHTKNAKPFRKWVSGEVLPSISHTGQYKLEDKKLFEEPKQLTVLDTLNAVKFIADDLRVNEASRINMYSKACENAGINSNFLPQYTDGKVVKSLKSLLEEFNVGMSSIAFNKLLLEIFMKEMLKLNGCTEKKAYLKNL